MSDADEYESSEDEQVKIARLFKETEAIQKAKLQKLQPNDSDDASGSDSDSIDMGVAPAVSKYYKTPSAPLGNRKRRSSSASASKYEKVRERMQRSAKMGNFDDDDSSSGSDNESNKGRIVVDIDAKVAAAVSKSASSAVSIYKENGVAICFSDSDDDDIPTRRSSARNGGITRNGGAVPTALQLMQRGVSVPPVDAMRLAVLREARLAIENQSSGVEVIDDIATAEEVGMTGDGPPAQMLNLSILPTLHYDAMQSNAAASKATQPPIHLTVPETTQVQEVMTQVLQTLKLKPKTNHILLQYNGNLLKRMFPLHHYGFTATAPTTIEAVIRSSDLVAGGKKSSAELAPNAGPMISVKLQRKVAGSNTSLEQDCIKVGCNEKLQALADRYVQTKQLPPSTVVVLYFDGDRLNLNTTPGSHDMDNNDLIDVVVQ